MNIPVIKLFPSVTWRIRTQEKILFLTFDDGPVPEATTEVLKMLSAYGAKATFFCIGENIERHPEIFNQITTAGHTAGHHTFHHLNGWYTASKSYLEDVDRGMQMIVSRLRETGSGRLFRPPYGKLKWSQYLFLKKRYKIVMWDVLTRDWEQKRTYEYCFNRIRKKARPGSIIVFHDSIKARDRMLPALEKTLQHFSGLGYRFESLEKFA